MPFTQPQPQPRLTPDPNRPTGEIEPTCAHPTTTAASPSPASASSARSATTCGPPGTTSSTAAAASARSPASTPSRYEAKTAGEVQRLRRRWQWLDARRSGGPRASLHFGVAAAKQAVADSGFEITDANRTEVGVVFGSGAGGQQLMIDNWRILQRARAPGGRPDVHRQRPRRLDLGDDRHRDRRHRPQHLHRLGLRDRAPTTWPRAPRRSAAATASRSSAARTEMPLLEVAHAGFGNMRGLAMPLPGGGHETVSPAVRQDARRLRARRGRRFAVPRGPRARQGRAARRSTPRSSATARPPTAGT